MSESRIEAYIMYKDGVIDRDCSGAGMIYGVHYGQIEEILKKVFNNFTDLFCDVIGDDEDFLAGSGCIDFNITQIIWDEGQQSFPESGLWDYLPHWEFDVEITRHEKWPENLQPEESGENREEPQF